MKINVFVICALMAFASLVDEVWAVTYPEINGYEVITNRYQADHSIQFVKFQIEQN